MNILKILGIYAKFGDVRKVMAEEGKAAPWYLSRKVIGAIIAFGASIALYFTGIDIGAGITEQLTDHIYNIITAAVGLYGIVMFLISLFKKKIVAERKIS